MIAVCDHTAHIRAQTETLLRDAIRQAGDPRDQVQAVVLPASTLQAHPWSSRARFSDPVERRARSGCARLWYDEGRPHLKEAADATDALRLDVQLAAL